MMNIDFDIDGLRWFDDSPDIGTPECICSACGKMIDNDSNGTLLQK